MPLEELNTTALKVDQADWSGDALIASGGGGIRYKTIVGPTWGNYRWHITTDKSIPGDGYGLLISSFSWFDYYLDFFQRHTTGDVDAFILEFRSKKWTVGFVDQKFPFTKVRLMNELFGTGGLDVQYFRVSGITYNADGSVALADAPTGLTLDFDDCTSLIASWDVPPDTEAPTVPVMTAPTGVGSDTITWNWNASTDDVAVTGYDLQVATDAGFTTGVRNIPLGNVLTYVDSGRTSSQTYYAHVLAHDAVPNNSAYSSSTNATTTAGLLLDTLGVSAAFAAGMRKLRNSYAGSCVRVRRASDNAEQDIGFASNILDWASAISFKGASSLTIVKWYDQSGNARDGDPLASGFQPVLDTSGELIDFDGSDDLIRIPATDLTATDKVTVLMVVKLDSTAGTQAIVSIDDQLGNSANIVVGSGLLVAQQKGSNNKYDPSPDTNIHVVSAVFDRSQAAASDTKLYVDSVDQTTTSDNTTNITGNFPGTFIGIGENSGASRSGMKAFEVIIIPDSLNTLGNRATGETDQGVFYSVPGY